MWKHARLALLTSLFLATGCGGSQKPNPLPPEEPMDPSGSSSSGSTTSTTGGTSPSDTTASSSADPSAGLSMTDPSAAGGATPAPTTPPPDTTDSDPKGKGKKGKGKGKGAKGELSSAECQQLSNKGIELMAASMGMSDPSMMSQLKAQAASDPNFAGMQTECVKSTTRAQYKCGMAATSKDAWEACLK